MQVLKNENEWLQPCLGHHDRALAGSAENGQRRRRRRRLGRRDWNPGSVVRGHVGRVGHRDGELLGVRPASHSVDHMLSPHGPYLQWGEGAGSSEADALIGYVAYDLGGAYGVGS